MTSSGFHCQDYWIDGIAWSYGYIGVLEPVYILQKKALKLMTFRGRRDNVDDVFRELCIMNIYQLCIFSSLILAKKILTGLTSLKSVNLQQIGHGHNTRGLERHDFSINTVNNNFGRHHFCFIVAKLWRSLPSDLTDPSLSLSNFRRLLKRHVLLLDIETIQDFWS